MPGHLHRSRPPRPSGDPTRGVTRLVVDVNNLLGALPRSRTALSPATLLGRLRAIVPTGGVVELVFDGPPARGAGPPGPGFVARYAGSRSADDVIVSLVDAAGRPRPGDNPAILVVTDDVALRRAVRELGAATAGTAWLIGRAERTRLATPTVGQSRPPTPPATARDEDRPSWHPGRGATVKRGNPRRVARNQRPPGDGRVGSG